MQRGRPPGSDAISLKSINGASSLGGTSARAWKTISSSTRIVSPAATASWLRVSRRCAPILDDTQQTLRRHGKSYNFRQARV